MKTKIYMILAAFALLTLSLNAQQVAQVRLDKHQLSSVQLKDLGKLGKPQAAQVRFNDVVRGSIQGMAGILPNGAMRAPMRYDATQYFTVGPFDGDNFDYGYGFPSAYDANQDITIVTQLQSSEYEDHYGDSIVGFRLALYGDGNKMAKVDEFVVRPSTATTIYTADGYAWALKDLTYVNPQGGDDEEPTPVATYDDIVIRPSSNAVNFTRIAVVSGSTTITEWAYPTNALPSTWTASTTFTVSTTYEAGYTSGTITIPGNLLTGYNNVQVVITAYGDNENTSITVGTQQSITTNSASYTWNIAASGSSSGGGTQTIEKYVKVTSTADLTSGDKYLIVYEGANRAFNGGLNSDQTNNYISVTITDNTIPANATTDAAAFTITSSGSYYTIRNANGYYIGRQSTQNGITYSTSTLYNNSISISSGNATIQQANYTRYLRYNTSDARFRYYGSNSANTQLPQLYKRVTETVETPTSGSVDGNYVNLATGQWHEFYLNQPVEFTMRDEATSMMMGYDYLQYPSSNTTQVLNPAAFNSQSTGHNHAVYLIQGSSSFDASGNIVITIPGGYNVMFNEIEVYDADTGNTLTSWSADGATTTITSGGTTYTVYAMPTGWTLGNSYMFTYSLTVGGEPMNFGYTSTSSQETITIANSLLNGATNVGVYIVAVATEADQTLIVNGVSQAMEELYVTPFEWDNIFNAPVAGWSLFNTTQGGDLAVQLIFKDGKLDAQAPTVTNVVGDANVVITITPDANTDGQLVYYVVDQNNQQTQNLTFPRGETDYTVTVHAYTTETDNYNESPEAVVTVTIPALPQTAAPVITYETVGDNVVITATGTGTVTLTVGDQTVTGNGSASITIPRTAADSSVTATATAKDGDHPVSETTTQVVPIPKLVTPTPSVVTTMDDGAVYITGQGTGVVHVYVNGVEVDPNDLPYVAGRGRTDYTVTVTVTAQEPGKAESSVTEVVTVPASTLPWTDDPTFTTDPQDLNYGITAVGDGNVIMYDENGHVIDNPTYFERLDHDYYVTVSATAQEDGHGMSDMVTQTFLIPARTSTPSTSGWTVLNNEKDPDDITTTYANSDVITWGKQVMFVDRFTASTADNQHPPRYTYRMQEKGNEGRTTNEHIIPVLHTGSRINGFYKLADVEADKDRLHMDLNVMNADVEMYLEQSADIYYYNIDRAKNSMEDSTFLPLSRLQHSGNIYAEMGRYFLPYAQPFPYDYVNRLDTINYVPNGGVQGAAGKHYGKYGPEANNFMAYVPVLWTFGNDPSNMRAHWGIDGDETHNSYGSPIWRTSVGDIVVDDIVSEVVRQKGTWATWTDSQGHPSSLYRAHIYAKGYLPHREVSNVDYEPYMFRIWVVSDSLRGFIKDDHIIDPVTGDTTHVGTGRLMPDPNFNEADTIMWLQDVYVNPAEIFNPGYYSILDYGDVSDKTSGFENDIVFGATNDANIKFIVRFYYRATGRSSSIIDDDEQSAGMRAPKRDAEYEDHSMMYYAAEGGFEPDDIPVAIYEIVFDYNHGVVVEQTYYNVMGMQSDKPFEGINIVVKRYSDGTTTSTKVLY